MQPDITYSGTHSPKKDLIVVGNKPPQMPGLAATIDSFDVVIRINRMNHIGATGNRLDCLYLEANNGFKYLRGGENRDLTKKAGKIFMKKLWYERFDSWSQFITPNQYNTIEIIDENFVIEETGFKRHTSSILLLGHLMNTDWSANYNIHITCLDVEHRAQLMDSNPNIWGYHRGAGILEQEYLLKHIQLNNLIRLHDE